MDLNNNLDILEAMQNIIEEYHEAIDLEDQLIQNFLLDVDDDGGNEEIYQEILENYNQDILLAILENLQYVNEEEDLFLFDDEREAHGGQFLHLDMNYFLGLPDSEFRKHFRMGRETFDILVIEVRNQLINSGKLIRLRTSTEASVLMTLWILGNMTTFREVAIIFGVSASVVHFHYVVAIEAISQLSQKFIKWPTADQRDIIKHACEDKSGFPNVVGAMDGVLIKVTKPLIQGPRYRDRHHSYSINNLAVCDHNMVFTHLFVRQPGSVHDSRVLKRSPIYNMLLEREDVVSADEHILADGGYPLFSKVLVPYRDNGRLTRRQRRFNYLLSSTRMMIERAFGRLKEKWRRLYRLYVKSHDIALNHIKACFVLHNFVILGGVEPDGMNADVPEHPEEEEEDDEAGEDERVHLLLPAAKVVGENKRNAIATLLNPDEI